MYGDGMSPLVLNAKTHLKGGRADLIFFLCAWKDSTVIPMKRTHDLRQYFLSR